MNFTEVLKAHGLTDEVIVRISAEMKQNKIFLASEENLDVRYQKLKLENEQNTQELAKSQALIGELQKGNKGNEDLQKQIEQYKGDIEALKVQNEKQRIDSALDRVLLENKVQDIDYVKYKIKEGKTELKLDENGTIKGINDIMENLKVQLPSQFNKTNSKINENKLPSGDSQPKGVTKEEYLKMSYKEREKLFQNDRETFNSLANSND